MKRIPLPGSKDRKVLDAIRRRPDTAVKLAKRTRLSLREVRSAIDHIRHHHGWPVVAKGEFGKMVFTIARRSSARKAA